MHMNSSRTANPDFWKQGLFSVLQSAGCELLHRPRHAAPTRSSSNVKCYAFIFPCIRSWLCAIVAIDDNDDDGDDDDDDDGGGGGGGGGGGC
jgi:hypothetical protein